MPILCYDVYQVYKFSILFSSFYTALKPYCFKTDPAGRSLLRNSPCIAFYSIDFNWI